LPVLVDQPFEEEFQYCRFCWLRWKVTVWLAPAARFTRWKPSSWRGGWPEAAGSLT
jgi:hypothetical protein